MCVCLIQSAEGLSRIKKQPTKARRNSEEDSLQTSAASSSFLDPQPASHTTGFELASLHYCAIHFLIISLFLYVFLWKHQTTHHPTPMQSTSLRVPPK